MIFHYLDVTAANANVAVKEKEKICCCLTANPPINMTCDMFGASRNGTVVNDDGEEQLDVYIEVSENRPHLVWFEFERFDLVCFGLLH